MSRVHYISPKGWKTPVYNPKWKGAKRLKQDTDSLVEAVLRGDITAFPRLLPLRRVPRPRMNSGRALMNRLHPKAVAHFALV